MCVKRPFRCIYEEKKTFLDNSTTITQEGNTETRQMTPFDSSTFSALTILNFRF